MRTKFSDIYFDVSNLFHIAYASVSRDLGIGEPSEKHPNLTPENMCSIAQTKRLNNHTCYEVFKKIHRINNEFRYPKGNSYFLLDAKDEDLNKRQNIRSMLAESYKQGRTHKSDNFYNIMKHLVFLLNNLDETYRVVTRPSFEADDLVKPLLESNKVVGCYSPTLLVSNDIDWTRDVDDTTVNILMDHKLYDLKMVSERLGRKVSKTTFLNYDTNRVIMYKMVFGDTSDGIFKPETLKGHKQDLLEFINELKSPRDLLNITNSTLRHTNASLGPKLLLKETTDALYTNYTLINYLDFKGDVDDFTTYCSYNKELLLRYIKSLQLEPNKIQPNLSTKIGYHNKPVRKFGMRLSTK